MIFNKTYVLLIAAILFFNMTHIDAQNHNQNALIDSLVNKHVALNESKMSMPGYRIQIFFGAQRSKATEIKTDFMMKYADVPSYLLYQQPNFKVRVGDFRTRLEAQKLLESIKTQFAVAFIVRDEVKLPGQTP